jgi:hypothetical protein
MTTKAFNCISNSTSIEPLKRPYYCCGWALPPLSFSGKWICVFTGNPPIYTPLVTTMSGVDFKYELASECIFFVNPSNNVPFYRYEVPGNPGFLGGMLVEATLELCSQQNGSDKQPFYPLNVPPLLAPPTFECSYNIITKQHTFRWESTGFYDFGGGDTAYISLVFDTVELA